ncbi:TonB-dependent receptor [Pseudoflavitalea rhizosphaerae]|uniref:TonB-dependent receptor n=1 Tax=Pseudoflavitalea rhizosphaerae TaxID=1884793 RepID=UPI0013DE95FE|nr:TonB-dependent receptor [Pseudoflavitalea rhizosphaerae]
MKLTAIFLFFAFLHAGANSFAQKVTYSEKNASLRQVFKVIEKQTGFTFFYNNRTLHSAKKISINVKDASLQQVLAECFRNQPLTYVIQNNVIIVSEKEEEPEANEPPAVPPLNIRGRVIDPEGNPLDGVSVFVKGKSKGTTTGADGVFTLNGVEENAVLQISFVGYSTQMYPVKGNSTITITLQKENRLEEMVVVSYGLQKRREIVGAVAEIKASELKDQPVGTFAERLQGKLPGVQLAQTNGRPGQGMDFRIRGAASISAGNNPLIVIDGLPINGNTDGINNINPDEVESFSVLKDAAATALYGSRAANGVILITTKKGRAGSMKIDFSASSGVASYMKNLKPEVMNATELATYMKGFYEDKIKYEGYTGGIPAEYQDPEKYGEGTDWYGLLLRKAPVQNYSMSLTTGSEKAVLSLVAGYFNQEGILKNTGYKRFSLRINAEFNISKAIKLGASLAPSLQLEHNIRQGGNFNFDGQRQIIASTLMMPPMASPYNPDGSLTLGYAGGFSNLFTWANPLRQIQEVNDDVTRGRLLSSVFAEFKFLKHFNFRSTIYGDIISMTRKKFIPSTSVGGFNNVPIDNAPAGNKSAIGEAGTSNNYAWINENILTWQKDIGDDHSLKVLAGFTAQRANDYTTTLTGRDYPDNKIPYISAATRVTASTGSQAWALLSYLGSVDYSFKGKYLLRASVRRDGSSRFGFANRYGTFPSAGIGWILSDESFMKNLPVISYLKLRTSYGLTGNNEIGNYTSIPLISTANYVFGNTLAPGAAQSTLGNSLLSWEKQKQFDIGADLGFFNDRILLTYDYYHKYTDGLLYRVNVPRSSGFANIQTNVGTIKSWGHEFSLTSKNLVGKFEWTTHFNISFDRNLVVKLGANDAPIAASPSVALSEFTDWRTEVGQPLGNFYGYVFDGVFMNQAELDKGPKHSTSKVGTVRMKDLNGDNMIDAANDRTWIGNPNPDFIFGMTNSFRYQGFDMSISLSGTYGNKLKNSMEESLYNMDGVFNGPKELLQRWRSEENPGNGRIQRTLAGSTVLSRADNSLFIHDASHLTINNITLGYSFKRSSWISILRNLRVYAGVQNAYIFTSYPGNPETSYNGLNGISQGEDIGAYPVARTFTFGLTAGF